MRTINPFAGIKNTEELLQKRCAWSSRYLPVREEDSEMDDEKGTYIKLPARYRKIDTSRIRTEPLKEAYQELMLHMEQLIGICQQVAPQLIADLSLADLPSLEAAKSLTHHKLRPKYQALFTLDKQLYIKLSEVYKQMANQNPTPAVEPVDLDDQAETFDNILPSSVSDLDEDIPFDFNKRIMEAADSVPPKPASPQIDAQAPTLQVSADEFRRFTPNQRRMIAEFISACSEIDVNMTLQFTHGANSFSAVLTDDGEGERGIIIESEDEFTKIKVEIVRTAKPRE